MRQLQLSNSANWELVHNDNVLAALLPKEGGGYKVVPIPEIEIALLFDVFVLAVRVATNVPPNKVWKFAGTIKQSVSTGISIDGSQDASFNRRYPLFLDKINLCLYPPISNSYSVSIKVPDWFQDASIAIWQYTGPDYDADLARIESKIDAL
ncbi:hypothetical protein ACX27_01830 [Nostoc piscinale CENA21]|uniref:Uncharacterized protein n=1 Tax=Nostoc piscinale CENA21 TaxID=224013 RepID=A0A0M4TSG5_9NOSO|nr:hypothetical protein [Nostoc piscinale]ALF51869.1 hypothetical protein ACX27_01830 [Nostoc piscinale CENA21]